MVMVTNNGEIEYWKSRWYIKHCTWLLFWTGSWFSTDFFSTHSSYLKDQLCYWVWEPKGSIVQSVLNLWGGCAHHRCRFFFFLHYFFFPNSSVRRVKACFSWYCLDLAVCSALKGNLKGCHIRTAGMNLNMCVQNIDLGDLASKRYRQKWYHFFKLYQMQKYITTAWKSTWKRKRYFFFSTEQQSCLISQTVFTGSHSEFLDHMEADVPCPESHQSAFWYMNLSVGWKYCSLTQVRQAPSSSRDVRQPHLVS